MGDKEEWVLMRGGVGWGGEECAKMRRIRRNESQSGSRGRMTHGDCYVSISKYVVLLI